ncbi:MAG: PDZ domain-containing protein [Phycisphaerae bacterium]|nr:PDZ domain-containing protein [Gemmatimonadaceae bacterium]
MKGRRFGIALVAVVAGIAGSFAAGAWWGDRTARRYDQWGPERLISTAIDSVRANALDALPSDELLRRAVSGMLRELRDPYAALLRPEGAREFRGLLGGNSQGLGLTLRRNGKHLGIARVFPGSPAASAQLRPGDRILSVNGVLVATHDPDRADAAGTKPAAATPSSDTSRLVVYRPLMGDTLSVTLKSGKWHVPATSDIVMLTRTVGYVALTTISINSSEELDDAIEELVDRGAKSVVLDLRGNGGGVLEEGVRIASLFLPRGSLVTSVTGKVGTPPLERRAPRGGRWEDLPITMLVDARTASAAEIVAAALRDHDRALLVGEPTYGKGLVQRVVALTPELSMRMTTARWMTPFGKVLERRHGSGIDALGGIRPDVFVPDAARPEAMATPPGLSEFAAARMLRLADSAAALALRESWSTETLSLLESRLHSAIDSLVGPMRGNPTGRATAIAVATRLATVRVLEVGGKQDVVVRYQAAADHALRAAIDVLVPGGQPFLVDAMPRTTIAPAPMKQKVAPSDSGPR